MKLNTLMVYKKVDIKISHLCHSYKQQNRTLHTKIFKNKKQTVRNRKTLNYIFHLRSPVV